MLWGDRASWNTWIGAVLAVLGLFFLSAIEGLRIALGDGYVLLGAVFWAGHVQLLARYAPRMDAIRLSFVQALFTSLLSFSVGFIQEPFEPGAILAAAWPIFYGGVISIGIAYTMQVIAQQSARPTPAAIILSLESVFAAFWGWLFLGEIFTLRGWGGSLLMLSGMVIAQLRIRRIKD
jgi:drug/metabolite transporter (DMT)-like permease